MKKIIVIALPLVLIVLLISLYWNERIERMEYKEKAKEWKIVALSEQEIPMVNVKAKQFIVDLGDGRHKKWLTGEALKQYKQAEKDSSEWEKEQQENNTVSDMQKANILLAHTESKGKNKAESRVLYQLHYKGIFDDPAQGMIDQRILTFLMNIHWKKNNGEYLVDKYSLELLEDTKGLGYSLSKEGVSTNE